MIGSERIRSWSRPIIQASSPLIFSVTLLFVMAKTKDVEAVRRALRVARAEFARDIGNLEATIKRRIPKCKKSLKKVRGLEKRAKELGGELSDSGSSRGSLLGDSGSDSSSASSESEAQAPVKKAEAKPVAAEKRKNEKSDGKVVPGPASKKPPRRSKESFPFLAPGEYAPNHRGKPNAEGVWYPGFPEKHPQHCKACEVMRRGFIRTGKSHIDGCLWRSRG